MDGRIVAPGLNTVGHQTSINLVRQQTYSTTSVVGKKHDHTEISKVPSETFKAALFERVHEESVSRASSLPLPNGETVRSLTASKIHHVTATAERPPVSEWTQRKLATSTPGPTQSPLLSLAHPSYGLPPALVRNLQAMGVRSIYPWQSSCLLGKHMLSGEKNLVYTAPTGGGKSLVAEILMLKRVIDDCRKKAIVVLPYVALVQEKTQWLRRLVEGVAKLAPQDAKAHLHTWKRKPLENSIKIGGFFGGSKSRTHWADIDIAVCTIEKANSLVNSAISEGSIDKLGVVVLDELHMLNDEHRGYMMELTATKLLSLDHRVQIIGMSATLPNMELIAKWLGAKYYQSKYRPIPIDEFLVYQNSIYPTSSSRVFLKTASQLASKGTRPAPDPVRVIDQAGHERLSNEVSNAVVALAVETAQTGYGALVFCGSRMACQGTATLISDAMPNIDSIDPTILEKRRDVMIDLHSLPNGYIDPVLRHTVLRGVAFHHAGLTTEEREIVAAAYDQGILKVMVATCSLAAGINLPARRVILQSARMGREMVGPAMLRQMRGRAGRKGKDEIGESYVCCAVADLEDVTELLESELPPVGSSLTPEKRGVKRALLEVVATNLATSRDAINDYVKRTLLYQTIDREKLECMVQTTIEELLETKCIRDIGVGLYEVTDMGHAIVAAALTPEDGIFVHDELQRARQAFVMDGEMHIFYLFTPVHINNLSEISWPTFQREMERLDESGIRTLQFIGVKPSLVNKMVLSGASFPENDASEITLARIYRRAYAAFQLQDLCNEIPIHAVARKYDTPRGFVQNLAQACHGFGAGMIKFCERMGWGMLAAVLDHMLDRLQAGARADLLEMCRVKHVKSRMARMFWEGGFRSVRAIAEAEARDLLPILMLAQPKKKSFSRSGPESDDHLNPADTTTDKYRQRLLQKAEDMIDSANKLREHQMRLEIDE